MGRKRNQGKARKAAKAKAREEVEERDNNNQTTMTTDDQSLEEQLLTRLGDGNLSPTSPSSGDTTIQCWHGSKFFGKLKTIGDFMEAFRKEFYEAARGPFVLIYCLGDAKNATMDEFAEVWNDSAKMENMMSWFLFVGTQAILKGEYDSARGDATIVRFMEQHVAVELKKTHALYNWPKVLETYDADLHTLVKFFRHRIPCSCLDEKYEEVKDIVKMGMCFNPQCAHPNRMTERSKTMYCSRCRCATYCSRECQIAAWTNHKPRCDWNLEKITEFEAMQLK
mmetsp:Transcript_12990/g.18610  ORF Transcript_12990/g.18610 Transcript_12990/m.18610 type:complete len:281 (+) Transcript_12990:22-864(+)